MRPITDLQFDNTYARLPEECFQRVEATPLPDPYLVSLNPAVAQVLDLDLGASTPSELAAYLSGSRQIPGAEPIAQVYAGHQFGVWVPRLGDGRAILLGEARNARGASWDLQLKGAGLTRFSRMGDGRAVLRSTIREYLCGEAMHGLGIPTTRSLSIVGSDLPVYREIPETAAVLLRVAPTHVRFGTFQYFASIDRQDLVRRLADFVIERHLPDLATRANPYAGLVEEAARRTGRLVARWMAAGFAHGVMNTDNMSILGFTLDYGPFGFQDHYEERFICNHSDHAGRYAFDQQPAVGLWNSARLAEAFLGLITEEEAYAALEAYRPAFDTEFLERLRQKLGLTTGEPEDGALITGLFKVLQAHHPDYTRFFRALCDVDPGPDALNAPLRRFFEEDPAFDAWLDGYRARLRREAGDPAIRSQAMRRANPAYVLRNWLAERAIRRATDEKEYGEIETLMDLLQDPYTERPGMEEYAASPPEWGRALVVSCSS